MRSRAYEVSATVHDVAARARVSIATVSRALNGLPVSARNHERVHKAAQELGYVANQAARALRSERSHTMGLIFFELRSTLGIELLDSLSESIDDAGYSLLISTARGDARRFELLMHRFLERRVDALFCVHARGDGETLARYRAAGIPVVAAISGTGAFAELPVIRPTIAEGAAALAGHLEGLGHRRVALVQHTAYRLHLAAVGQALESRGMTIEQLVTSELGGMNELVAGWMARRARPTALIAPGGHARALLTACDASGVKVPNDMSVVGLIRLGTQSGLASRALSCLTLDPHRLGRAAGAAMLGWLAGARPADSVRVETGVFVARATTGKAARG